MAIGWLTVLKALPWSDVISNAPKVAEGAKKLWSAVPRRGPAPQAADEAPVGSADGDLQAAAAPAASRDEMAEAVAVLRLGVTHLDTSVGELQEQMVASSALIKALAEQNTHLIERVEAHRVRVLYLTVATAIVGVVAVVALVVALTY